MGAAPQGLTSHPIAANHWWTTGRKRTPVNTTTTAAANAGSAKQGRKPYNSSQFPDPADFWKRRKKVVLLFVCLLAGLDPANRELASATFVSSCCPPFCWFGCLGQQCTPSLFISYTESLFVWPGGQHFTFTNYAAFLKSGFFGNKRFKTANNILWYVSSP